MLALVAPHIDVVLDISLDVERKQAQAIASLADLIKILL